MNDITIEQKYEDEFYLGKIDEKQCVLTLYGVGKVNATRKTQIMIDSYQIEYLINCGVAGGLSDKVNIFDIVDRIKY